jgi:hypothetical protein
VAVGSISVIILALFGGIVAFVADFMWSLPNTLVGALFLALNLVFGNELDRSFNGRNMVGLRNGASLYLPLVLANYVLATVAPYWLLYHDRTRSPINGVTSYFRRGVYPHVWNEEWAYRVAG